MKKRERKNISGERPSVRSSSLCSILLSRRGQSALASTHVIRRLAESVLSVVVRAKRLTASNMLSLPYSVGYGSHCLIYEGVTCVDSFHYLHVMSRCNLLTNYYYLQTPSISAQIFYLLHAARGYASAALAVMRCLCVRVFVRVSVTFVDSVETNKHIFQIFFHYRVATPL